MRTEGEVSTCIAFGISIGFFVGTIFGWGVMGYDLKSLQKQAYERGYAEYGPNGWEWVEEHEDATEE